MTWRRGRATVGDYVARDGTRRPIELAYETLGDGTPLLLVMGINAQRIFWDDRLCARLAAAGFRVIRFDHRDTGESTHLDAPVPRAGRALARRMVGAAIHAPYTLSDMAGDVIGLCDHLTIERAHVVGVSLGGMVGQHLAIEHAPRVRSLVAIMTATSARRFLPTPRALGALFAPAPRSVEEAGRHVEQLFRAIGSPVFAHDAARLRAIGEEAHRRGASPRGFLRQFAAVLASGDRERALRGVNVPTLVIHGTRDPLMPIAAGRALARAVPHATWLPLAGMGHHLAEELWDVIARAIARHAAAA